MSKKKVTLKSTLELVDSIPDRLPDYHVFLEIDANFRELLEEKIPIELINKLKDLISSHTRCDFIRVALLWVLARNYRYLAYGWRSYSRDGPPEGKLEICDHGRQFVHDVAHGYMQKEPRGCRCHPGQLKALIEFIASESEYHTKIGWSYFHDVVFRHQLASRR